MFLIKKKYNNTYKLNKFQNINIDFKYILITRFIFLNSKQLKQLKIQLKSLNNDFYIFKKSLIQQLKPLKGQGNILLIYSNTFDHYQKILAFLIIYKINILYILINKTLISYYKIKNQKISSKQLLQNINCFFLKFILILKLKQRRV